jgi:hypothetical protein
VKLPVPDPACVCDPEIVGFAESPQQIPLAVTVAPPSEVTFPPAATLVEVIEPVAEVVTDGKAICCEVVNVTSLP